MYTQKPLSDTSVNDLPAIQMDPFTIDKEEQPQHPLLIVESDPAAESAALTLSYLTQLIGLVEKNKNHLKLIYFEYEFDSYKFNSKAMEERLKAYAADHDKITQLNPEELKKLCDSFNTHQQAWITAQAILAALGVAILLGTLGISPILFGLDVLHPGHGPDPLFAWIGYALVTWAVFSGGFLGTLQYKSDMAVATEEKFVAIQSAIEKWQAGIFNQNTTTKNPIQGNISSPAKTNTPEMTSTNSTSCSS